MDEKIVLLLMGSIIGLVSSLATRLFDEWLTSRRQKREWEKSRREKQLNEIHDFMDKGLYRELPTSNKHKNLISNILLRGSTMGFLLGFIAIIMMILLGLFSQTSPIMVFVVALFLFLGWWIGKQGLKLIWKAKK
jgi:hypothetical protein